MGICLECRFLDTVKHPIPEKLHLRNMHFSQVHRMILRFSLKSEPGYVRLYFFMGAISLGKTNKKV